MEPKIKAFDCVAESRKWRETTSASLNAMSREERLSYLHSVGERVRAELRGPVATRGAATATAPVVREDAAEYGKKES